MFTKHKNILFTIIALIIIFFGYWYFFLSKKSDPVAGDNTGLSVTANSSDASSPTTNAYDKEFVANLQTVRYIDLNPTILTSAAYKAMTFPEKPFEVDYNIPVGRRNPFLPIGVDARESASANSQVQDTPVIDSVPNTVIDTTTPPAATTTTPVQPKKR
ncbi:MAG: hypothetical protein V4576_02565 [Patescibacteria group bacterium]